MKIEFYTPKNETIPTRLRLKVDDSIDVYYESLNETFGYKFEFCPFTQPVDVELATAIVDEIVSKMVSQSYDHGAQWRECRVREIINDEFELSISVFFECVTLDEGGLT